MELVHTFTVPVPPAQAFAVLQDIERIGPCMPGAAIESVDGRRFSGSVTVKIGPIKVTYQGEAEYVEIDADGLTATIDARGKESRGSGTANAMVTAELREVPEGSEVHVVTDLAITGKPAQFGRGVMEEVGQKLINQFADCLSTTMGEPPAAPGAPASSPSPPSMQVPAPPRAAPEVEAIDLFDVAGAPVAKRLAPVAGLLLLVLLWRALRRR